MVTQKIILQLIDDYGWDIFSNKMLEAQSQLSLKQINEALHKLINNGYIFQLEKGKYCRHNYRDENVIASFIAKNGGIAYWSAMHHHGLTEQIPNVMYVQTTQAKKNQIIFGVRYNFIRVKEEKLIGFKTLGYGNHQFNITDIEKTIVDCFDLPQYSGGYAEIIKAFNKANLSAQKMIKYCKAVNNLAIIKRLAYLSELLCKPNMDKYYQYAISVKDKNYNLFEINGNKAGKTNSRWNLILNMDEKEILEMANS